MSAPSRTPLQLELEAHRRLCLELYDLFRDENQALLEEQNPLPARFQEGRRQLLGRVNQSLQRIRALAEPSRDVATQAIIQSSLDLILKAVKMDRENENLMLRRGMFPPGSMPSVAARNPTMLRNTYAKR